MAAAGTRPPVSMGAGAVRRGGGAGFDDFFATEDRHSSSETDTLYVMARLLMIVLVAVTGAGALSAQQPPSIKDGPPIKAALHARSFQPGEVIRMTITAPAVVNRADIRAFDHAWAAYKLNPTTWEVLIGIDLDCKTGPYQVDWTLQWDGTLGPTTSRSKEAFTVVDKKFVTRTLTVDDAYVNPPATVTARIEEETVRLSKLWQTATPERLWTQPFAVPVTESPNSAFGSRSVFNGEARSPHSGADFPTPAGSPIKAPNAGKVVIAEDLYFSGNTVIIDHGLGLYSQLAHMSAIDVHVGDRVEQGQVVGKVGATGRVTGPHLHWAIRLSVARVDPLSLLAATAPDKTSK